MTGPCGEQKAWQTKRSHLPCVPQDSLVKLFQDAGFRCEEYKVHERQIENRRQEVTMHRRWVQAAFTYLPNKPHTGPPTSTVSAEPTLMAQANAATSEATADRHTRQGATSALGCTAQPAMLSDHQQLPGPLGRAVTGTSSLPHATVPVTPSQQTDQDHQHCISAALAPGSKHHRSQAAADEGQQLLSSPDSLQAVASAQQACGSAEPQYMSGVANRQLPTAPGQASRQQQQGQGKPVAADSRARPGTEQEGQCGAAVGIVQRQEWEERGTEPEEGLLTGSLFDEDGFEEVPSIFAVAASHAGVCVCVEEGGFSSMAHACAVGRTLQSADCLQLNECLLMLGSTSSELPCQLYNACWFRSAQLVQQF